VNARAQCELSTYFNAFRQARLSPPTLTSTDRTPAQNARVGGVANSKHLYGLAADWIPAGTWPFHVSFRALAANGRLWLPYWELIAESDHVHGEAPWEYLNLR